MGVTVLLIAVGGMSSSIVSSMALQRTNEETVTAQAAARSLVEALRGETFTDVFARYDTNPANDPAGAGTAPGADFAVTGLTAAPDDADGFCGRVEFPTTTVGGIDQLREDSADTRLGTPRDLNGDGAIDSLNHAADYVSLPVRVRVRWAGVTGTRELTLETILCSR